MDKFNALTTLVCVVEQNSFSRAAEQLGKTPSAVAKAIAALEEEQGIRLFERTTRRMQLTEAGRLYAQAAREALNCLSNASEEIGQMQHGLHGELRISAALAFGGSSASAVGIISTVGLSMFPFILPSSINAQSSLTVWNASSSHTTLFIMLIVVAVFLPFVLLYTAWVYKVLWGRSSTAALKTNPDLY